jgi:hypothetical protein
MRRGTIPAGRRLRPAERRLGKTDLTRRCMRTCGVVHIQCRGEYTCAYKYVVRSLIEPFFDEYAIVIYIFLVLSWTFVSVSCCHIILLVVVTVCKYRISDFPFIRSN